MALGGKVYDITKYMDYHPGGREELLRGAGCDASDLFLKVHAWVRVDNFLEKFLVGHMQFASSHLLSVPLPKSNHFADQQSDVISIPLPGSTSAAAAKAPKPPSVTRTWAQSDSNLIMLFRVRGASKERISVEVGEGTQVHIVTDTVDYVFLFRPHGALMRSVAITPQSDSVRVVFDKDKASAGMWPTFGEVLSEKISEESVASATTAVRCVLTRREAVTHDTYLFTFFTQRELDVDRMGIGAHVVLTATLPGGGQVSRNYTVVAPLFPILEPANRNTLKLLIKVYADGKMTRPLGAMGLGDSVQAGLVAGTVPCPPPGCPVVLIAGGTGLVPMLRVLQRCRASRDQGQQAMDHDQATGDQGPGLCGLLLCYNRSERDMLLANELESLASPTFRVLHILSEPSAEWTGLRGRITDCCPLPSCAELARLTPPASPSSVDSVSPLSPFPLSPASLSPLPTFALPRTAAPTPWAFVCGRAAFATSARAALTARGFPADHVHVFL